MHIAVSWDIKAENPRWGIINERLLEKIKPYSWVRPVNTFYVIKVDSVERRVEIVKSLTQAAQGVPESVFFVVTPLMVGGRYDGLLPKENWDQLNERTD